MSLNNKNISNHLKNPETRLALHLDQTPLAVIDWDTDFYVLSWNKAAEKIFGYSSKEAIGKHPSELINPESIKEEIYEIGTKLLKNTGSTRSSNENIRKDGKKIYCEWYNTTLVDNEGEVVGISSLVMDITERKKEQELFDEKDSMLKAFTRALPDVSFIYDEDGKYVEILAGEEALLYAQPDVMKGKSIFDIFSGDIAGELHNVILETIKTNKSQIFEYKLNLPSVETWFEARTSPMDKKVDGKKTIVWLAHDITDSKKAEKKIQELLLEKEMILKEVHHRIKNNMYVISSLLYMQADKINNPDLNSAFQDAISRIDSMGILYDKLYRTENYEALGVKDYLAQLIKEVLNIFPDVSNIKLEQQIDELDIGPNIMFPLGIIINEILTNIMKYAFVGKDSGLVQITLKNNEGEIILIIKDDGNGFPEYFDIDKHDGFGISLIKMLTEQLDGHFKMENDNGAKFVFEFRI